MVYKMDIFHSQFFRILTNMKRVLLAMQLSPLQGKSIGYKGEPL